MLIQAALHFAFGTIGSLAVFLVLNRLSGVSRFSAPFGLVFIGIACASLAHFVSPWATPVVIMIYALIEIRQIQRDRKDNKPGPREDID